MELAEVWLDRHGRCEKCFGEKSAQPVPNWICGREGGGRVRESRRQPGLQLAGLRCHPSTKLGFSGGT